MNNPKSINEIMKGCIFTTTYWLAGETLMRCQNAIYRKLQTLGELYNCRFQYDTQPMINPHFNKSVAKKAYKLEFLVLEKQVVVVFYSYGCKPYSCSYKRII